MGKQIWHVLQFEVTRTLKKPSFWILTLLFPVMIGAFAILGSLGGKSAAESTQIGASEHITFVYEDQSGMIDPAVAEAAGGQKVDNAEQFKESVISGELDAVIVYPKNLQEDLTTIVAKERGLFANVAYDSLASSLVQESAEKEISNKQLIDMLKGRIRSDITTYKDGKKSGTFADVIAPGVFLILFYFSIVLLGNQMLNATVEEKENRVTEIILTSMNPMNLLFGKVLGLLVLGAVQVLLLVGTVLLAGVVFGTFISDAEVAPGASAADVAQSISLVGIPINPLRTFLAFGLFSSAFIMTSGLLTMTGAMVGNAKDAGQVFGFVIMGLMIPYATLLLIVNEPSSLVTQILTWFPLTSPITVMIRNAVGNMAALQVSLALLMQLVVGVIFFSIGARLFGAGALAYQGMSVKQAVSTLLNR